MNIVRPRAKLALGEGPVSEVLRVFISSPGDVAKARRAAASVVEKIAPDYLRHFRIEPYLWENEPTRASGHFQDAIEPPSRFDVVLLILWSRLGTPLPERTDVRAYTGMDGRAPVTGTEWEFEDALRAARQSPEGLPHLLVYRSRQSAGVDAWDAGKREEELRQLAALDEFWRRHFRDGGGFIGAYREFSREDELAATFEQELRQVVEQRIAAARPAAEGGRVWTQAPFRGLEGFDQEHAPIFFGREQAIAKALDQLIENAERGRAFLLISGASGSGKSSLMKAGLAPRLSLPGRVTGKRFLRRAAFRPQDRAPGENLFGALARVLLGQGRPGEGLREAGQADRLARVLAGEPAQAAEFLGGALDRVAEAARTRGEIFETETACLLLLVDQLEELFTDERLAPDERRRFVDLLAALAAAGQVWVVATLRSDHWHRAAETPVLVGLADGAGRLELLRPSPAELSQMIRLPAEAAGLTFEPHPVDGVPLNDRIAEAAAQAPGVLPLMSYLLEQLYQADIVDGSGQVLTWATYEALGGLKGAIAARAETILAEQPEPAREALRRVLFALVQTGDEPGAAPTARRAPRSAFHDDAAAQALIEAFLAPRARLLVADEAPSGAGLRVAHEALLTEWARARVIIAEDALLLAIRREMEARHARWRTLQAHTRRIWSPFAHEEGLVSGADLADAQRLATAFGMELEPELAAYIERSARHDRTRRRASLLMVSGVALGMAGLAVAAGLQALLAQRNLNQAVALEHSSMLALQKAGYHDLIEKRDAEAGVEEYGRVAENAAKLVELDPADPMWRYDLAAGLFWQGYAYHMRRQAGDEAHATALYRQALTAAKVAEGSAKGHADIEKNLQSLETDVGARLTGR